MSDISMYRFSQEQERVNGPREKAAKAVEDLEMPESIRTPGRTWTRYPHIDISSAGDISPEIEVKGEAEVFQGAEAIEKAGDNLLDSIKYDENKLNAYHTALMNSLIYVEVDGSVDIEISYKEEEPVFSHLIVKTNQGSKATITEEFEGSSRMVTSFAELYIGKNSDVTYGAVESIDAELSYSRRKAIVDRDASMSWLNGLFGGKLNRTLVETVLKGDNSETEKIGVWYPTDDQHVDISMHVDHRGANTRCDMKSRAAVDDESRSVYEGLQHVGDGADDTSSFQDEKVISLSDKAEVDASPKLMIEDPDVEASHAASAGNVPKDELHYLESRGLTEEKARKLVVKGFFEPVMDEMTLPDLKDGVREEIRKKLE